MAKPLVSDELWAIVEPLLPKVERRYRFPGRKRIDWSRAVIDSSHIRAVGGASRPDQAQSTAPEAAPSTIR